MNENIRDGAENARSFWQKATLAEKFVLVVGAVYVLSPIDIVPEALLGPIGLLDDGGAVMILLMKAKAISSRR